MIEIIIGKIDMPPLKDRRYQLKPLDCNGKKWNVLEDGVEVHRGKYENMSLISYNLNKKYYKELNSLK